MWVSVCQLQQSNNNKKNWKHPLKAVLRRNRFEVVPVKAVSERVYINTDVQIGCSKKSTLSSLRWLVDQTSSCDNFENFIPSEDFFGGFEINFWRNKFHRNETLFIKIGTKNIKARVYYTRTLVLVQLSTILSVQLHALLYKIV